VRVNDVAIRQGAIAALGCARSGPPGTARPPVSAGRTGAHRR